MKCYELGSRSQRYILNVFRPNVFLLNVAAPFIVSKQFPFFPLFFPLKLSLVNSDFFVVSSTLFNGAFKIAHKYFSSIKYSDKMIQNFHAVSVVLRETKLACLPLSNRFRLVSHLIVRLQWSNILLPFPADIKLDRK